MSTESKTVLIYVADEADQRTIEYGCQQLAYAALKAADPAEAQAHLAAARPAMVFVDLSLKKLELAPEVPVVAVGEISIHNDLKVLNYKRACFIPKPLSPASVMLGLQRASGLFVDGKSYVSDVVNIANALREIQFQLTAIYGNESNRVNFGKAVADYCTTSCELSKTDAELSETDRGRFDLLSYFTARGALYCDRLASCPLHRFAEFTVATMPSLHATSAIEELEGHFRAAVGANLLEFSKKIAERYEDFVGQLYALKREYCRKECEQHVDGMGFGKGDTLLVSTGELMSGVCAFCSERQCSLENFFQLFRRIIL